MQLTETPIPEIHDSGDLPYKLTDNCTIVQAAQFFYKKNIYKVNKEIWNHLNNDQKAILVLHEVIYNEAAKLGHKDSTIVRTINGVFFTKNRYYYDQVDSLMTSPFSPKTTPVEEYSDAIRYSISEGVIFELVTKTLDIENNYCESEDFKNAFMFTWHRFRNQSFPTLNSLLDSRIQH